MTKVVGNKSLKDLIINEIMCIRGFNKKGEKAKLRIFGKFAYS